MLDLGCGDGSLLAHLQRERGCSGYGVEIDDANVLRLRRAGVNVIQLNLEDGPALFDDARFDVVLQLDTLQHCATPSACCARRRASGRIGIVTLPQLRPLAEPPAACCAGACR